MTDPAAAIAGALADRYRIERPLGAGGMATVYLAEDVKHERRVALKVLRPELAAAIGPERFLREIKITARLHHPHILELYDSGEAAGFLYYVMPFVDGESLRQRLEREKQLPLQDALRIAREVADALSYAHSLGIIHRDVKPENILLQAGHAVVADFGIARAVTTAGGEQLTETGVSIGTPTYMSPEQAGGEHELDGRSDLYALGCVLFEMLAGRAPFTGPTVESVIHQHLAAQPPAITSIRPAVPAAVSDALTRALAKTPADRFNPVAQFGEALLAGEGGAAPLPVQRAGARWRPLGVAAGVLAVVAAAAILLRGRTPAEPPTITTGRATQITFETGLELDPVLSPDGSMVAYAAGPAGRERIYLRPVAGGRPIALTDGSTRSRNPQWMPDGNQISYESPDGIFAVPALGGAPRRLFASPPEGLWSHAWSPDGQAVAYATTDSVVIRPVDGGAPPRTVAVYFPSSLAWSPDGAYVAASSGNASFVFGVVSRQFAYNQQAFANVAPASLWIVPARGGPATQVTDGRFMDMSPSWLPDGRLLFMSNRDGSRDLYLLALGRDATPAGAPRRVTTGLNVHSARVSADGTHLVYSRFEPQANIWIVDLPDRGSVSIAAARRLTSGSQFIEGIALSSDGRWLAFDSDRSGNQDVFKMALPDGEPIRLTTHEAADFVWSWSWDGAVLLGHTFRFGGRDPFELAADGSRFTVIARDSAQERYPSLSPDGQLVVTDQEVGGTVTRREVRLRHRAADGSWGPARPLGPAAGGGATFAPVGARILYTDLIGGIAQVLDTAGRILVTVRGPGGANVVNARWTPDGTRIVFKTLADDGTQSLWSMASDGGPARQLVRFDDPGRPWLRDEFATDGRRIYLVLSEHESDIWMVETESR